VSVGAVTDWDGTTLGSAVFVGNASACAEDPAGTEAAEGVLVVTMTAPAPVPV
jgi:hypothetical protein